MASAGWMRFWRRDRKANASAESVACAAARGESLAKILDLVALRLLQRGGAERAGIWLQDPDHADFYTGTVVETCSAPVPEQWRRVDVSAPFFRTILASPDPLVADVNGSSGVPLIGPLAGMRRVIWIPVRIRERILGLALAGYLRARPAADLRGLRILADDLAVVVAQRRDWESDQRRQADVEARTEIQRAILRGAPLRQTLSQIALQARQQVRAEFVALAQGDAARFDIFEGPREWAALLEEETVGNLCRAALKQDGPMELDAQAFRSLK